MMRLSMPWTSLFLFVGWQMLMGQVSLMSILAGALLAWLLPYFTARFTPPVSTAKYPGKIAHLVVIVIIDIIKSNLTVARLVLGDLEKLSPGFITVPIDTDHPYVINLVASIITMTPGTVAADVEQTPGTPGARILVHVLNCEDEQALINEIKERYEKPLLEIFQC